VAVHLGLVETDMMTEDFRHLGFDIPELAGEVMVWLSAEKARFLSGRVISANWDVGGLVTRKNEIAGEGLLQLDKETETGEVGYNGCPSALERELLPSQYVDVDEEIRAAVGSGREIGAAPEEAGMADIQSMRSRSTTTSRSASSPVIIKLPSMLPSGAISM